MATPSISPHSAASIVNDEITTNSTYNNATFATNGKVNGSTVHNDAAIAWLLLNINPTNTTQSEGPSGQ